jgi:pimeloyl-ACP methyl ester carboxylesterase
MRYSHGYQRYVTLEDDITGGPVTAWGHPGTVGGVIFCHGVGGTYAYSRDITKTGAYPLYDTLCNNFLTIAPQLGGDTWGNSTGNTRVGQAKTYLQTTEVAKSGKIAIVGLSMGAIVALNYTREFPTNVACVVGIIPVIDIEDIRANNRSGLAAGINTAYGGSYVEATQGSTRNPSTYASTMSVPTKLWYASDDATALASKVTAYASAATNVTTVSVGALGHTEAAIAAATITDIVAFINTYL